MVLPNNDNKYVASVHHQCPLCLSPCEEQLLIHKRFGDLSKIDHKPVGVATEPCSKCKEAISLGLLIIEVSEEKSVAGQDPYRTGRIFVIKKETGERLFAEVFNEPYPFNGACFISDVVLEKLGFNDPQED